MVLTKHQIRQSQIFKNFLLILNNFSQEILASGGKGDIQQFELQQNILDHLLQGYQTAIQETKCYINNEINSKVQKSVELKRAARPKSRKRKRQDNSVTNNDDNV